MIVPFSEITSGVVTVVVVFKGIVVELNVTGIIVSEATVVVVVFVVFSGASSLDMVSLCLSFVSVDVSGVVSGSLVFGNNVPMLSDPLFSCVMLMTSVRLDGRLVLLFIMD